MKDSADIRKLNKDKIRQILWTGKSYSKHDISIETGLSVATCNTLLNDLAQTGEVIEEKKRLKEVGPSTALYQINETYESLLCIHFELAGGIKTLTSTLLSITGKILIQTTTDLDWINCTIIADTICNFQDQCGNISQIVVGTPSIAENGIITHCDIPELEKAALVEELESILHIPVYLENDMHLKAYGYYKKHRNTGDIFTLANFPSHVLPGTASIHAGKVIKGNNQFAGMVGFLPYGMERKEQIDMLNKTTCRPLISKALTSIIAIINPKNILLTGDLLDDSSLEWIKTDCLKFIPEEYMPAFSYQSNLNDYYLEGMYQIALDLKGVYND